MAPPARNMMMSTSMQASAYLEKMPFCLCGNRAIYVCDKEECVHFKSLKSRLSKERYSCENCMYKFHDHRPIFIVKKTFEVAQKWVDQDRTLVNIENQFKNNMHDYMDLVFHYENFSENKKL